MKKSYLLLSLIFAGILAISFGSAVDCTKIVISKTTQGLFSEIPVVDSNLQSCIVMVDSSVNSLVGNGDVQVDVMMSSGSVQSFYLTLNNKQITHVTSGAAASPNYVVETNEATLDRILSSNDVVNEILIAYHKKEIKIVAKGFFNKIKFFFAKFFIPKGNSNSGNQNTVTGKPDYCDETYLPGHRNYAENKELWDGYSADTDKVCQSQYGKGIPSPCVHSVQLSIEGNPYYLCWYNE